MAMSGFAGGGAGFGSGFAGDQGGEFAGVVQFLHFHGLEFDAEPAFRFDHQADMGH